MAKKKTNEKTVAPASSGHDQIKTRAKQAGFSPTNTDGFRKLSGNPDRDLPPITQDRMIEIAYYLWRSNALAHWLVETNKDFILGNGVTITVDDADNGAPLQELIDEFFNDPVNNFPLWLEDQVRELGIYGEQCWPAFVNEHTGLVRLAGIDPALIKSVIPDPDNARLMIGVEIKVSATLKKARKLRIIYNASDESIFSAATVKLRASYADGECFLFSINKISTATRGGSDFLHLTDWIDGYDQFLFNFAERSELLGSFIWDVLLEGADDAAIKAFLADNPPPKKGAVRAHNEKATWSAVTPDIKAGDTDTGARLLRNHIISSAGMPEHYFGGGGDVNRATADSMGLPTFKRLQSRQNKHKAMLETVIDFQITQALKVGRLKSVENPYAYTVNFPEMVIKDYSAVAGTLSSLVSALSVAETQGWVDKDTARKIFSIPAGLMGVDIDLCEVAAKSEEEQEMADAIDYFGKQIRATQAVEQKPSRITKAPKWGS